MPIATQNPAPASAGRTRPDAPQQPSTPAAPSAPVANPGAPIQAIQAMQAQLVELSIQAANLRVTVHGLNRQINAMRASNPARIALQQQAATAAAQLAGVEGKMAELQARIAAQQGVTPDRISEQGTLLPPPSNAPFRRGVDPDMVIGLSFVLAMCVVLPISIGFAKRVWKGRPLPPAPRMDDVSPRLERLEQAVDSIAIEIERISEGQRFVTKILAERPAQSAAAVQGQEAGADEGKPIRALGAGPAEQVRVNDRHSVKQGINQR